MLTFKLEKTEVHLSLWVIWCISGLRSTVRVIKLFLSEQSSQLICVLNKFTSKKTQCLRFTLIRRPDLMESACLTFQTIFITLLQLTMCTKRILAYRSVCRTAKKKITFKKLQMFELMKRNRTAQHCNTNLHSSSSVLPLSGLVSVFHSRLTL